MMQPVPYSSMACTNTVHQSPAPRTVAWCPSKRSACMLVQGRRKQNGFGQANGVGVIFARGVWGHAPPGKFAF